MIDLGRWKLLAVAVAVSFAIAAASTVGLIALVRATARDAAELARAERDAHWRAEIAASNATVEAERARLERAALSASETASAEIARLRSSLSELEARNAALPDTDACGLDRDRARLLR